MASVGFGADVGAAPGFDLEQSRSPRSCSPSTRAAGSSARRSATTSICAMSRGVRRCCSARPRTTTRRPRSARSSACSMRLLARRRRAGRVTLKVEGEDGFPARGRTGRWPRSAASPEELVGADHRAAPPISGRLRALSRHDVRADQGSRRAGQGLHPQGRRHRCTISTPTSRRVGQPGAAVAATVRLDLRRQPSDARPGRGGAAVKLAAVETFMEPSEAHDI